VRPEKFPIEQIFFATAMVAGISILAWLNRRRRPWLAVGWLWFVVMLLPVTAVQLPRLFIADRYTYLPGIGFCVMLVWGLVEAGELFLTRRAGKIFAVTLAIAVLLLCALQTRGQLAYWRNTQTLLEHALKIDPANPVAQINLRIYLFDQQHPGVRENHRTIPLNSTNSP
jgi:hypothetical protein